MTRVPDLSQRRPFRAGTFTSPLHDERLAAILGISLGVAFSICFATGLYSHLAQHPPSWFELPARPAGLYRLTQGLHVATGIASIPLLLAKLWVVYPKLFRWPPFDSFASVVERLSLVPLIAGGFFMLASGLANINLWYPWQFSFPVTHYWVAWITMGGLVVHIGAKRATAVRALRTTLGRRRRRRRRRRGRRAHPDADGRGGRRGTGGDSSSASSRPEGCSRW